MIYGREYWGPKVWYMLHAFSMNNNKKLYKDKKHNYYIFYTSLLYIIPCEECREHYTIILNDINRINEDCIDRKYMKKWVYNTHNIVNDFLDKPKYKYSKLKDDYKKINTNDIFYTLKILLENIDYNDISISAYDHIYNFFVNFCLLFPDETIRTNLTNLIERNHFTKITNPKQFEKWLKEYFFN